MGILRNKKGAQRRILVIAACLTLCMGALCACSSPKKVDVSQSFENTSVADPSAQGGATAAVSADTSNTETKTNASGVVVIDAGHQARGDSAQEPVGPGAAETKARVTSGTSGVSTGNAEDAINLAVALKLKAAFEARGISVVMVRTTADVDISNAERAAIANEAHASLFIRLHCDGVDNSSTNGFMTLIPGQNEWTAPIVSQSAKAADIMHPLIIAATGARDRGVIERTDLSGFNWCEVPTVLFEMGCMSNPAEDERLGTASYQQLLADSIADATVVYLNS
jgi:N-acetylmuramoyl-L-alanine amidase